MLKKSAAKILHGRVCCSTVPQQKADQEIKNWKSNQRPQHFSKFDALHKQMFGEDVYPSIQTTRAAFAAAKTAFAEIIPEDINQKEVAAIRAVTLSQ